MPAPTSVRDHFQGIGTNIPAMIGCPPAISIYGLDEETGASL